MQLIIVESPTKARTISKFLGKDYEIRASMGHIMDLPKSTLGVEIENNFQPDYQIVGDRKGTIVELKMLAKKAESVILATDPDREGEAIASHIFNVLSQNQKSKIKNQKYTRIVFHEITRDAIFEALKNPGIINKQLVDAQTARRILDRLVGYKLSPLLWQKVRRGLSAGRVQSIALRLIVEREKEREKFGKENYWTIKVILEGTKRRDSIASPLQNGKKNIETEFDLIEINGQKIESQKTFDLYDGEYKISKTNIDTEKKAKEILSDLTQMNYLVKDVLQKSMHRSPYPPYTTSTLQQDAAYRLGFSGKRTMSAAQKLYEEGHITYHRTDSVNLSSNFTTAARSFIKKTYGDKYVPEKQRVYKTRQKLAQEAHEAIRPTKIDENSKFEIRNSKLGNDCFRLYELIWQRAISSQMSDAVIESTSVMVSAEVGHENFLVHSAKKADVLEFQKPASANSENFVSSSRSSYLLKANGSVLVFDGFLRVNPQALEDRRLPVFISGEELNYVNSDTISHETMPPPRYNDASIIKTLEEKGIGRPSTYATIIGTIEVRKYIEREQNRFVPTPVGIAVNVFLVENFGDIDDIPFTVQMEDELDAIALGKKDWIDVMREFYEPFEKKLALVKDAARVKITAEEVDEKCPKCGNSLVIRHGKFGKFLSCSTFPECDFRKSFILETAYMCPKDNGKVIVKKTKKGRTFYGCSNYPACDFAVWKLSDIKTEEKK